MGVMFERHWTWLAMEGSTPNTTSLHCGNFTSVFESWIWFWVLDQCLSTCYISVLLKYGSCVSTNLMEVIFWNLNLWLFWLHWLFFIGRKKTVVATLKFSGLIRTWVENLTWMPDKISIIILPWIWITHLIFDLSSLPDDYCIALSNNWHHFRYTYKNIKHFSNAHFCFMKFWNP